MLVFWKTQGRAGGEILVCAQPRPGPARARQAQPYLFLRQGVVVRVHQLQQRSARSVSNRAGEGGSSAPPRRSAPLASSRPPTQPGRPGWPTPPRGGPTLTGPRQTPTSIAWPSSRSKVTAQTHSSQADNRPQGNGDGRRRRGRASDSMATVWVRPFLLDHEAPARAQSLPPSQCARALPLPAGRAGRGAAAEGRALPSGALALHSGTASPATLGSASGGVPVTGTAHAHASLEPRPSVLPFWNWSDGRPCSRRIHPRDR